MKFEKVEVNIFEEVRKTVNKELSEKCPKAFEKLTEAYEDLIKSESSLDLQQVALACRVVLKDFADKIYPPTNEKVIGTDNIKRPLKEDDYVNRITAYIQKSIKSESNEMFIISNLNYLAAFISGVNRIANVETHNEKSKEYAERCIIYTYLLLGDIINFTR